MRGVFEEDGSPGCDGCAIIFPGGMSLAWGPAERYRGQIMKYVVSWRERPAASSREYEAAHERILAIFKDWQMPASFKVHQFVVRVGDYGGYMILETDKVTDIHWFTSVFAAFECKVEPVVDVMDAVAAELQAIEFRRKKAP